MCEDVGIFTERMPMDVTPHDLGDLVELRRRIRTESNAKQRDRYRAVLMALEGETTTCIMDKLDRSKNFVQRWVYIYRDHGLERVRPIPQPGQPPRLGRDQHDAFRRRIDSADRILRGRDVVEILANEFGVVCSLSTAYDLLHRVGYEPLKPRPANPKKDPDAEKAWKQRAPFLSSPSETPTPSKPSKSGSRTNADSDKKDV